MKVNVVAPCRVGGFYRLRVFKSDGDLKSEVGFFENLMLDNGLEIVADELSYMNLCFVGSDSTPPAVSDTQLGSLVGTSSAISDTQSGNNSVSPYYTYRINTYRFAQGDAAGNLAEVGVGKASTNLLSRSLIKDGMGNPTTITVLSDEVLEVTYEFRIYPNETDATGTVTISGSGDHDYTMRPALVTNGAWWRLISTGTPANESGQWVVYDGAIGGVTGSPSGASELLSQAGGEPYSAGSKTMEFKNTAGLDDGNFAGGIKSVRASCGWGTWQVEFTPAIPKDSMKILTLTLSHSWARGS